MLLRLVILNRNIARVSGIENGKEYTVNPANASSFMNKTLWKDSRLASLDNIGDIPHLAKTLEEERDTEVSLKSIKRLRSPRMEVTYKSLAALECNTSYGALNILTGESGEVFKVGNTGLEVRCI